MRIPKDPDRQLGGDFFLKKVFVDYNGKLFPVKMLACRVVSVTQCKKTECWVDGQELRDIQPHGKGFKVLWRDLIPFDSVKCCKCPIHCPKY